MSKEYWVLAALTIASILLVTVFGRADKARESLFLFLAAQATCWPVTLLLVFAGFLANPVRLFPKATDSDFIVAFVFYPAVFVAYYWHCPRSKGRAIEIIYTLVFSGAAALIHVALQKYTSLILYITFSGYNLWIIGAIAFYGVRFYADWYFSQLMKADSGDTI